MKTKDKPQAKQYVIYSRKSKFTGKGESIENQIELCRQYIACLLYTSPSPRYGATSRMPSSA